MGRNETLDTSPLPTLVRASIAPICVDVKIVERDDATTTVRTIDPSAGPRRGLLEAIAAAALLVLVASTAAGFEAARTHARAPADGITREPRAASVFAAREATIEHTATAPEKTTFDDAEPAPPAPRHTKTAASPKPRPRYPWMDR